LLQALVVLHGVVVEAAAHHRAGRGSRGWRGPAARWRLAPFSHPCSRCNQRYSRRRRWGPRLVSVAAHLFGSPSGSPWGRRRCRRRRSRSWTHGWGRPPRTRCEIPATAGQRDRSCVADLVAGAHAAVQMMHICGSNSRKGLARSAGGVASGSRALLATHARSRPCPPSRRWSELAAIVAGTGEAAMGDNVVAQAGVARLALHHPVAGEAAVGVVGQMIERTALRVSASSRVLVRTCIPSATLLVQESCRPRAPSISTRHMRQPA